MSASITSGAFGKRAFSASRSLALPVVAVVLVLVLVTTDSGSRRALSLLIIIMLVSTDMHRRLIYEQNTYLTGISARTMLEASVITVRLELAAVAVETVSRAI